MKTQVFLDSIFYIGENAQDNFDVIDKGGSDDLWFHAKHVSSCHVVVVTVQKNKKLRTIIRQAALLCKQYTNKLSKNPTTEIIYTKLKHVTKTDTIGCVLTTNTKEIIV